jgi:hypothetical protein
MATILPTAQPNHIVSVLSYNPIDTGVLMGVDVTIRDLLGSQVSIIETTRGLQGYTGPRGSGFRYFTDSDNPSSFIEASGTSDTLFINSSGNTQIFFDNTTKTLTIGSTPLDTGNIPFSIDIGGTNNTIYDTNYLIYYDGNKLTSSTVDATMISNFMSTGTTLKIGDGTNVVISYNMKDKLNIVSSSGIEIIYDDITNTISIGSSGTKKTMSPLVSSLIFG